MSYVILLGLLCGGAALWMTSEKRTASNVKIAKDQATKRARFARPQPDDVVTGRGMVKNRKRRFGNR